MEYSTGSLMIFAGLVREGVDCFESARRRFDGERRNPWDEPECGHHYARAMSAWSGLLAYSGFRYDGPRQTVAMAPAAAFRRLPLLLGDRHRLGRIRAPRERRPHRLSPASGSRQFVGAELRVERARYEGDGHDGRGGSAARL